MPYETLFQLANLAVLPLWALMIFAPHWRGTQAVLRSFIPVSVLAVLYATLLIQSFFDPNPALNPADLANPTLAVIAAGLSTPAGATIGWVHFLAFDLFAGRWIYLDSRERGLSAWWVGPCLFFTLMAGPLGLLLYFGVRRWASRPQPQA